MTPYEKARETRQAEIEYAEAVLWERFEAQRSGVKPLARGVAPRRAEADTWGWKP